MSVAISEMRQRMSQRIGHGRGRAVKPEFRISNRSSSLMNAYRRDWEKLGPDRFCPDGATAIPFYQRGLASISGSKSVFRLNPSGLSCRCCSAPECGEGLIKPSRPFDESMRPPSRRKAHQRYSAAGGSSRRRGRSRWPCMARRITTLPSFVS